MQDLYDLVVATAQAFPSPSLDDLVMTKITETFMDGMKGMRKKYLLAVNKARNSKEREGAAAAGLPLDGVDARPAEGPHPHPGAALALAPAGPAASAEDPAGAQPAEKKKGGRMASGSGFTWKELKGSFGAPTPV